MKTISIIILVGKRADVIQGCLNSVKDFGEIIIVDLGMDEATRKIVKSYKCHLVPGEEKYDFSLWRNQGTRVAQGEWLLYIDSDERLTKALKSEIISTISPSSPLRVGDQPRPEDDQPLAETIQLSNHQSPHNQHIINTQLTTNQPSSISGYYIPRKNYFLGKFFTTTWPDYQLRLIKKSALNSWQGKVHELPLVQGEIGKLVNPIIHLSHWDLETMLTNTINWSKIEAANRLNSGHPAMTTWRFFRILLTGFWENFAVKKLWREGVPGTIEGIYQMFSLFITYFRLWEMQRRESLKDSYEKIERELNN